MASDSAASSHMHDREDADTSTGHYSRDYHDEKKTCHDCFGTEWIETGVAVELLRALNELPTKWPPHPKLGANLVGLSQNAENSIDYIVDCNTRFPGNGLRYTRLTERPRRALLPLRALAGRHRDKPRKFHKRDIDLIITAQEEISEWNAFADTFCRESFEAAHGPWTPSGPGDSATQNLCSCALCRGSLPHDAEDSDTDEASSSSSSSCFESSTLETDDIDPNGCFEPPQREP